MKRGNLELVIEITLLLALIPATLGYYANYKGRWIISLLCYLLSVTILTVPIVAYVTFKIIQHCMPFILRTLAKINHIVLPIAHYIAHNKILSPFISIFIRSQFFFWFMVLLMSDHLIRIIVGRFQGPHATNRYLSLINVGDSNFFKTAAEELKETPKDQHHQPIQKLYGSSGKLEYRKPEYSLSTAHTLSVASKLAYEDVDVVKYELEQAGYDVEHTFKAIGYKNVCAYIVEKNNQVMLVFRGTNPLNIQNYVTNIDAGLTKVSSNNGYMGKVHKGFWDAMGVTDSSEDLHADNALSEIRLDLSTASLYQSITTSVFAIVRIMKALSFNIFANVIDPIDASWAGENASIIRHQSMYTQAVNTALSILKEDKNKKLYVTGHSLGGALATVFVAKMIQSESPLMAHFAGLYTFGQPNIGDKDFGKSFSTDITCKIFNHTYNNDVVPRIPYWYSPPPGTLVFIDSSHKISIYPPNPKNNEPIPVRPISYLHLSGLLNLSVIRRMKNESSIRILFRILFPFFINDHFPSGYSEALLTGDVEWVIIGEKEGGNEEVV